MSSIKKASTLRVANEDLAACLDQKNNMISVLQAEVEDLRVNQEKYDRVKEQLVRAKNRLESLVREQDCTRENNQERLELSAKNLFELKVQIDHLESELRNKGQQLREAKYHSQQLMEHSHRKEDEIADAEIRLQEQNSLTEFRKMEEERTKLQLLQVRDEVDRQKKEISAVRQQTDSISEKSHKTQSYIRNLLREEASLNENLTKVEDENNRLDESICQLDGVISLKQGEIANLEKDCHEFRFFIASKELEKKRIENEIKEKAKNLAVEKDKAKNLAEQFEQRRNDGLRLEGHLKDTCEEINFISAKNNDIFEVNEQLKEDLKVCQRHLDNVLRINKFIEGELVQFEQTSAAAIKKIQTPIVARTPNILNKYSCSSWRTSAETGDVEAFDKYSS